MRTHITLAALSLTTIASCAANPSQPTQAAAPTQPAPAAPPAPQPAQAALQNEFTLSPPYHPAPELTARPDVPKGTLHHFVMKSQDSELYPGVAKDKPGQTVPYQRTVNVYIPANYTANSPAPLLIVQDGNSPQYRDTLPTILDNLIHEHRVPALIAVMVESGGGDGFGSERGLEYDTVSDKYTTFIESEVLPAVAKQYNVAFTTDPTARATMGGSSGAACAFTMAWFHPELYSRVLSYSGTFVNQENPPHPEVSRGAWEYHQTLIPNAPTKNIRIWLHVSENDFGANREEATLHNWVTANQHMAAALRMKGYKYHYVYAQGANHVDNGVVRQTLPSALEWLWQDYKTP